MVENEFGTKILKDKSMPNKSYALTGMAGTVQE